MPAPSFPTSSSLEAYATATQPKRPMSYNRTNHGRNPHHQATWPILTTSVPMAQGPPSASPFSPTANMMTARNVSEILPRLYISDLAFAENPSLLTSYRITHILSTLPDRIFHPPPTLLPMQPTRLQVGIEDLPFAELAGHLPATTNFIREALASSPDTRVLVHCVEGISRSVSVVAAFLMAQYGWSPSEAVLFIKNKRRVADPNFGFVQQLYEYARNSLGRVHAPPVQPSYHNHAVAPGAS